MTDMTMADWQTLSNRINRVAPSATLAVDSKAKAMKAAGIDAIGFGAGEPNFPTPAPIVAAAACAVQDPKNYRYTPTAGLPELRKAIADKVSRDSGYEVDPSQVVVTNGGKQAVYEAFQILLDEGDEVIIPAPYWTSYPEAVKLAGLETVIGGVLALVSGLAFGFASGAATGDAAAIFWVALVCGGLAPLVCGWLARSKPASAVTMATVAFAGGIIGSIAFRAVMWMVGTAVANYFGIVL